MLQRSFAGTSAPAIAAFDRWLNRELTQLYDSALAEPVPDELLRLLDQPKQR